MNKKLNRYSVMMAVFLGFATILSAQVMYTINFNRNDFKIEKKLGPDSVWYDVVINPSLPRIEKVGAPDLPFRIVSLIVPADKKVKSVTLIKVVTETLPEKYLLYPVQPPIPTGPNPQSDTFVGPDPSIYGSANPYPQQCKFAGDGYLDGNHIAEILVYPFLYIPSSRKLVFYRTISLSVNMGGSQKTKASVVRDGMRDIRYQKIYDALLENAVDNKKDVPTYRRKPVTRPPGSKRPKTKDGEVFYDYVIVTSQALAPAFNDFATWKRMKGIDIGIKAIEDIKANYTGGDIVPWINDDAGKVRQYLRLAHNNGTVYVLLGGDVIIDPVRFGHGWGEEIPADLYFSDLDGNWDANHNGIYGEWGVDTPQWEPELFVGRLLCNSVTDVTRWSEKVIKYEQNPGNGDYTYLTKSLFVQADQMQHQNDAASLAQHLPLAFSHTVMQEGLNYDSWYPALTITTAADVIAELNKHYGLFFPCVHGGPGALAVMTQGVFSSGAGTHCVNSVDAADIGGNPHDGNYEIEEANDGFDCLTNYEHPCVVYSFSCDNIPYDICRSYGNAGFPNLGEAFTLVSLGGGPAYLGNTRYGWIGSSEALMTLFLDLVFSSGTYDLPYQHLGVAEAAARYYPNNYLRYSHNLLGCPETRLWTALPQKLTGVAVSCANHDMTVDAGVGGCDICVCSVNAADGYFEVASNVQTHTFAGVQGPVYVTITKPNYIPWTQLINCVGQDLWAMDGLNDNGQEPDVVTQYPWTSPDIWIRNTVDPLHLYKHVHENPIYGQPNYIYVSVRNRGCQPGNCELHLYWAKASTGLAWPWNWINPPMGNEITIPNPPMINNVLPGEERIVEVKWNNLPNPNDYQAWGLDKAHFCLLARIVSANDPMAVPEGMDICANTVNNNNIVWKNVNIITTEKGAGSDFVIVRNPSRDTTRVRIVFNESIEPGIKSLLNSMHITVRLSPGLAQAWRSGGNIRDGISFLKGDAFELISPNASIGHIIMPPGTMFALQVTFKRKNQKQPSKPGVWNIIQFTEGVEKPDGGVELLIDPVKLTVRGTKSESESPNRFENKR